MRPINKYYAWLLASVSFVSLAACSPQTPQEPQKWTYEVCDDTQITNNDCPEAGNYVIEVVNDVSE